MENKIVCSLIFIALLLGGTHAGASPLVVMSYNIRREGAEKAETRLWQNRLPLIATLLKNIKPDIIGFQEVINHQQEDLQKELPDFNMIGESRGSSWWGLATDEATPIAYKKDAFELKDHGTFSVNPELNSWTWMPWHRAETGLLPRVCTWAKLKDKQTNKEFYVYNTHLDHMYRQAREISAQKVMQDVEQRTPGYPVIMMGDFNTPIEGEMKNILTRQFMLAKDKTERVEGPRETATGWDNTKLAEIDHILVNKLITAVERYRVVEADGYPSDHRPVVADIQL
jgi:endonuclease/exonuclease/phosphatase family metal-dependent hydrolase